MRAAARRNSQFLSSGPPATPILRSLRSEIALIGDVGGTTSPPSVDDWGRKRTVLPSDLRRNANNKSCTIVSTEPERNAMRAASVEARGDRLDPNPFGRVEAVMRDRVDFPLHRPERQQSDLERRRLRVGPRLTRQQAGGRASQHPPPGDLGAMNPRRCRHGVSLPRFATAASRDPRGGLFGRLAPRVTARSFSNDAHRNGDLQRGARAESHGVKGSPLCTRCTKPRISRRSSSIPWLSASSAPLHRQFSSRIVRRTKRQRRSARLSRRVAPSIAVAEATERGVWQYVMLGRCLYVRSPTSSPRTDGRRSARLARRPAEIRQREDCPYIRIRIYGSC